MKSKEFIARLKRPAELFIAEPAWEIAARVHNAAPGKTHVGPGTLLRRRAVGILNFQRPRESYRHYRRSKHPEDKDCAGRRSTAGQRSAADEGQQEAIPSVRRSRAGFLRKKTRPWG